MQLSATSCGIEAFEMIGEEAVGDRFAVLGDVEADAWELVQLLHAKTRREGPRHQTVADWD